ncbi:MAG TPA: M28 family peptidase [Saprospiraceae bacterium]|nr:M28 family peptidase [Saprospiraceae bacterium]
MRIILFILAFSAFGLACKHDNNKSDTTQPKKKDLFIPDFNQDSAYVYIEQQLAFGPRVPGTKAHLECRDYLVNKLESFGVKTQLQEFKANFLDQNNVNSYNIIGTINPNATKRILLSAHWDSRMIADKDDNADMKNKPILGADDGASGVAVILELASVFHKYPLENLGIDIVLFDAEDQGKDNENWCLGAKYWTTHPHRPGYSAKYGILLDMVGAKGATFRYEANAYQFDQELHEAIWTLAGDLGYGNFFIPQMSGTIEDDHYYIMKNMGIPMVDIINTKMGNQGGFGDYHHTHEDNLDIINKRTLQVVGKLMCNVIYRENA